MLRQSRTEQVGYFTPAKYLVYFQTVNEQERYDERRPKRRLGILTSRMRRGLGVDLTLHQIAEQLIRRNWEVTVFTIEDDGEYHESGYGIVGLDIPPKRLCLDHDLAARAKVDRLNEHAPDAWLVSAPPLL